MRTHHESDSQIGSQRNQLLVQALIANHLQGMQHQRFGLLRLSDKFTNQSEAWLTDNTQHK